MSNKYFRLMESPEPTWKPYQELPLSDDHPEMGTYKSDTYVSHPQKGDYLVQSADGSVYVTRPSYREHFDTVQFYAMPSLHDLQSKGLLVEVPADIARKEFYLQEKMSDLALELQVAEGHLADLEHDMAERRFGFPTKAAREAKQEYIALQPVISNMNRQFDELDSQLQHQVIAPLKELQKQNKKTISLDDKISHAEVRSQKIPDKGLGMVMGKETGHDR